MVRNAHVTKESRIKFMKRGMMTVPAPCYLHLCVGVDLNALGRILPVLGCCKYALNIYCFLLKHLRLLNLNVKSLTSQMYVNFTAAHKSIQYFYAFFHSSPILPVRIKGLDDFGFGSFLSYREQLKLFQSTYCQRSDSY